MPEYIQTLETTVDIASFAEIMRITDLIHPTRKSELRRGHHQRLNELRKEKLPFKVETPLEATIASLHAHIKEVDNTDLFYPTSKSELLSEQAELRRTGSETLIVNGFYEKREVIFPLVREESLALSQYFDLDARRLQGIIIFPRSGDTPPHVELWTVRIIYGPSRLKQVIPELADTQRRARSNQLLPIPHISFVKTYSTQLLEVLESSISPMQKPVVKQECVQIHTAMTGLFLNSRFAEYEEGYAPANHRLSESLTLSEYVKHLKTFGETHNPLKVNTASLADFREVLESHLRAPVLTRFFKIKEDRFVKPLSDKMSSILAEMVEWNHSTLKPVFALSVSRCGSASLDLWACKDTQPSLT